METPKLRYRLITGIDDSSFCERISGLLAEGYQLYGSPSVTFNGKNVIAAQALIWPVVANEASLQNPSEK